MTKQKPKRYLLKGMEVDVTLLALVIASEQYIALANIQKTKAQKMTMINLSINAAILHQAITKTNKKKGA